MNGGASGSVGPITQPTVDEKEEVLRGYLIIEYPPIGEHFQDRATLLSDLERFGLEFVVVVSTGHLWWRKSIYVFRFNMPLSQRAIAYLESKAIKHGHSLLPLR